MSWLDLLMACATLAIALTAVRGRTWDESKPGLAGLTNVGWAAVIAAIAMLVLTLLKARTDAREKQELGDQVADIASKTMIGLTQELNRENADMRLTPRVALFPATRLTEESPALSKGEPLALAQALVGGLATVLSGEVVVRLFGEDTEAKRDMAELGMVRDAKSAISMPHLFAARINDPSRGPYAFNAVVQYGEQRDTTKVVQAIFEKKARLTVMLLLRNVRDRSTLEAHVRQQMGTGFGYFRLSDKARPNLCFSLDAKEVVAKGIKPTELRLVWQIGVVGGIRANGCPAMGA